MRHNRLAQRVAIECSRAVAGVSLEARLLLDGSDDRPGDVYLATVPHVLTSQTPARATGFHAMEAARSRKERKYLERCRTAGVGFSVLAFDTLGASHPGTEEFLKEVFKEASRREVRPDPRYASRAQGFRSLRAPPHRTGARETHGTLGAKPLQAQAARRPDVPTGRRPSFFTSA